MYPNPVSNILEIQIPDAVENSSYEVEIQDMTGRSINRQNTLGSTSIDMSELNNGIFICKIYKENQLIFTQKVVKLH